MKYSILLILIISVLYGIRSWHDNVNEDIFAYRAWRDDSGRKVEAKLIQVEPASIIILRKSDQQEFSWPTINLSEADRAHIQKLNQNRPAMKEEIARLLSSFPKGLEKQYTSTRTSKKLRLNAEDDVSKYYNTRDYKKKTFSKRLEVSEAGFIDRYKFAFKNVQASNYHSQLGTIRTLMERDSKRLRQLSKNDTMRGQQAELDLLWLLGKLKPYLKLWEAIGENYFYLLPPDDPYMR